MFPDFPSVKRRANSVIIEAVQRQVALEDPLVGSIRRTRIHEGRSAALTRSDLSTDTIEMREGSAAMTVTRDQMRRISLDELRQHVVSLARQFAEHQAKVMFEKLEKTVKETGNEVSAKELGRKRAFLELERRVEADFDPQTLERKNLTIVMHPSQLEQFKAELDEWLKDPDFVAERERIKTQQLEVWRARENSRKLAD